MFPSNSWGFQQQANNQTSNSPRWRKKGGKSRQTWSRKKERFESIGGYSGIGKIKLQKLIMLWEILADFVQPAFKSHRSSGKQRTLIINFI